MRIQTEDNHPFNLILSWFTESRWNRYHIPYTSKWNFTRNFTVKIKLYNLL